MFRSSNKIKNSDTIIQKDREFAIKQLTNDEQANIAWNRTK